jgi:hypothetical protein
MIRTAISQPDRKRSEPDVLRKKSPNAAPLLPVASRKICGSGWPVGLARMVLRSPRVKQMARRNMKPRVPLGVSDHSL